MTGWAIANCQLPIANWIKFQVGQFQIAIGPISPIGPIANWQLAIGNRQSSGSPSMPDNIERKLHLFAHAHQTMDGGRCLHIEVATVDAEFTHRA
jgi:hypothetical protein